MKRIGLIDIAEWHILMCSATVDTGLCVLSKFSDPLLHFSITMYVPWNHPRGSQFRANHVASLGSMCDTELDSCQVYDSATPSSTKINNLQLRSEDGLNSTEFLQSCIGHF
ncbi:unnamed protein product [Sphenostylis stenocarpa]|uniref:Uncharacterized protein n=1 Tax=Sphenostylis stenocarpa TaxID=92480 RepID=A0AA86VN21_9FABA|nr:unnamed protein product [Sphenostylis stenocarpa]